MDVNFKINPAGKVDPIYFEQVYAEKPGGGLVANPNYDILPTTAVAKDSSTGKYVPIKAYRLVEAVGSEDTTIKIAKGSGIVSGDVIGHAKKAVASTAVDFSNADYDVVTVTLGVAIATDTVLYQALSASASSAKPVKDPEYLVGKTVFAGEGDQLIRLVNGANIRKETANVADEVAALIPTIKLV